MISKIDTLPLYNCAIVNSEELDLWLISVHAQGIETTYAKSFYFIFDVNLLVPFSDHFKIIFTHFKILRDFKIPR